MSTTDAGTPTIGPADALLFELLATPEGRADPYARYAELRERWPVHRLVLDASAGTGGTWVLSRFDHCQAVLRHPRVGKDFAAMQRRWGLTEEELAAQVRFTDDRRSMLFRDPPDHTRLRGLVSKAFTPRTVEALRPHVVRLVDDLLDEVGVGEVEVMTALAFPLPVTVIGEMLGVPLDDRPQFQRLVRASAASLEPFVTPEALAAANAATLEMEAYFRGLVAERRMAPADDLLSHLIAAEDNGDQLTEQELLSTAILLFAAGFETTTNLIGNGLLALLRHPDQLERLRHDPALLPSAVEELLRYDSPVQVNGRVAGDDVDIDGHHIPAGATVLTLLGAANRDPRRFSDPERLDVGRSEGSSMSFGSGIHFCLGAALARMEGQVFFGRLLERYPTIELLDESPAYRDSITLRGLAELPVALGSRRADASGRTVSVV
ncbi:MAG: cytochrome P450 [Actinobacteria bacterium]|nr:cytochrome P450 [Actinomycetota bacterium]